MSGRFARWIPAIALLVIAAPALADDLSGAEIFLCAPVQATHCTRDGGCETGPPWMWNIPQFIRIDLEAERVTTTRASEENRSTPIQQITRDSGLIFLQGVENGRAYSFVIAPETGMASFSVAADGLSVAAFGACTPEVQP